MKFIKSFLGEGTVGKVTRVMWWITFSIVLLMFICVFAISQGWFGKVPSVSELQNPIDKSSSKVYSSDGKLLCTWSYASANRIMVPYDSLPENLVKALVATEDERFYEHSGIDAKALGRAVVKRLIMGQKSAGGGSTITQQLAKQLYSDVAKDDKKRMMQKPIEWYIAVQLERYYTKEEIIAMYFNKFDFLNTAVGIRNASEVYFGKLPIDLNIEECATLVGMCKNPSLYNPITRTEFCKERRNVVLAQMHKVGYITKEEMQEAQSRDLDISKFHVTKHTEGEAPYFREHLRLIMMAKRPDRKNYASWQYQQYHDDSLAWENDPLYGWCNKNTKKDGSPYNIYEDGLRVYTTIDTRMQKMAEDAMFQHVAQYLQPHFDAEIKNSPTAPYKGMTKEKMNKIIDRNIRQSEHWRILKAEGKTDEEAMAIFDIPVEMDLFAYGSTYNDPKSIHVTMSPRDSIIYYKKFLRGAMCAMDPSNGAVMAYVPGLDFQHFQFDNVLGGGHRQVGSTIKPLLYSLAVSSLGYTPCDVVSTVPRNYGGWTPRGGAGAGGGALPLKAALSSSNNQASVYLLNQIQPKNFISFLRDQLQISDVGMYPNLTLALGSCDISVGEMCSAYTIFPSFGVHYAPLLVTRIEDSDGNVITTFTPRMTEVLSKENAYQMIDMTRGVVNHGTGRALRGAPYNISADMGGKTGTTNSNADGWFIGFCPKLVVAAWVGGDDRDIHFGSMAFGQGAKAALPIYGHFMRRVYKSNLFGINMGDKFAIPSDFEFCSSSLDGLHSVDWVEPVHEPEPEMDDEFFE